MAQELIISVSGMRGVIGENLGPATAADYGCAFGTFLRSAAPPDTRRLSVCIGRDSRPSGPMLVAAVAAGLSAVGIDVIDLGIVTTPGVGIMLRHLACAGGVVVTASHNPVQYNGIKLLLQNGVAPPPEHARRIRQIYSDKSFAAVDSTNCGALSENRQAEDVHMEKVLALVDARAIAEKKFRVVLDSVNGAGGPVTKKFLAALGCTVMPVNDEPTGLFAHEPEPTAENLSGLCRAVRENAADVGFAQDPDADRLALVDESGRYIGEEYTLALAAAHMLAENTAAAANLSTSRMIDDIARRAGARVFRTPVGEANVAAAMIDNNCIIGGEGNGGVIDLRVGPIRDSLVAIALVLQLMTDTSKNITTLVGEIPAYSMQKLKFPADRDCAQTIIRRAKDLFATARIDTRDGCRFDFDDGWIHLRSSNTEPVMRAIVEAKDRHALDKYLKMIQRIRSTTEDTSQP